MAFMICNTEDGRVPAWEYYNAAGLVPKAGMALKLSAGKLVLSTGTARPQFIAMRSQDTAVAEGDAPIPVVAVTDDMVLEVPTTATLAPGASASVGSDGLSVITGEGAAVVVANGENGFVRVRFK